tara:strand:- start:149 stop:331 length:183 start_codon:yes stop_codon:yes gene_type:complete
MEEYLWLLGQTVIAEFKTYAEAMQEFERLPENFELYIGDKSSMVPKESITICSKHIYLHS